MKKTIYKILVAIFAIIVIATVFYHMLVDTLQEKTIAFAISIFVNIVTLLIIYFSNNKKIKET